MWCIVEIQVVSIATAVLLCSRTLGWNFPQLHELEIKVKNVIEIVEFTECDFQD